MDRRQIFLLVIVSVILSGCSFLAWQAVVPEHEIGKSYEIGEVYKVSTGSKIIRLENLKLLPAFTPIFEYQPPRAGLNSMPKLIPGQVWKAVRFTYKPEDKGFVILSTNYSAWAGIHILENGTIGRGWINVPGAAIMAQGNWIEKPLFTKTEGVAEKGSFAAELIYSGLSQNTLRIMYREFTDDLARPAFYQELTYDLSESKNIIFRSITLQVMEATNSYISFKVVDDGGLPWMPKQ